MTTIFGRDMPPPPGGPHVLIVPKQRIPDLSSTWISGWLTPAVDGGGIHWFRNRQPLSGAEAKSLAYLQGALTLDDGLFAQLRVVPLFGDNWWNASRPHVERWLNSWVARQLATKQDAGSFLRICADGHGVERLVRDDVEWGKLAYARLPLPTTRGDMTLQSLLEHQNGQKSLAALSVWNNEMANNASPPGDNVPPLTVMLGKLGLRDAVEALAEMYRVRLWYHDEHSRPAQPAHELPSRSECRALEGIFHETFKKCDLPWVRVAVNVGETFAEDARIYRSSGRLEPEWLETALLRVRADSTLVELIRRLPHNAIIDSRLPLTVFYHATHWCTGNLGPYDGAPRRQFWPSIHRQLEHTRGMPEREADELREQMIRNARDVYYGQPER